ncbi:MAG: ankyrin repeat domain-containing protein [Proteobacteria bacterium]|nr:ankyrin repeat domain-containing protein [Pseudomonadota bacterium]
MVSIIETTPNKLNLSDYSKIIKNHLLTNPLSNENTLLFTDIVVSPECFSSKNLTSADYAMHMAAKKGDTIEILTLFCNGFNVNQTNSRNITPLDVAAMYGQTNAVKILVQIGGWVNEGAYEDHTPLHFALLNSHYDTAEVLLKMGKANPNLRDINGKNAFDITVDHLENRIDAYNLNPSDQGQAGIVEVLNMISLLANYADQPALFHETSITQPQETLFETPVSVILKVLGSTVTSQEIRNLIIDTANEVDALFPTEQVFINAKDLLATFPTGQEYQANLGGVNAWVAADGHYGLYTTELASNSLGLFSQQLDNVDPLKQDVFSSMYITFQHSLELIAKSAQPYAASTALNLYETGNTVLIPSGWDGHFIDIILSSQQAWYVTANSGDRYHGEYPQYTPDPAGVIIYEMTDPGLIDTQFIYNAANNMDRMKLEIDLPYDYDIFGVLDIFERPDQLFENCAWESHRDAVEGLAYVELVNRNIEQETAKTLANTYFQEWDDFHGNYMIEHYLSQNPILPVQAMLDVLQNIQQDPSPSHDHGQRIANALISPIYIDEFKEWLQTDPQDEPSKTLINALQEQYGIDISKLINEPATTDLQNNSVTDTLPLAASLEAPIPHLDPMVLLAQQPQFVNL